MASRHFFRRLSPILRGASRVLPVARSAYLPRHTVLCQDLASRLTSVRCVTKDAPAAEIVNIQDEDDFQDKVFQSKKPVIVDFHASWCGPCKLLGPRLEAIVAAEKGRVVMAKVDIDENVEIAVRFDDDQELIKILHNLADPVKTSSQTSFKREFGLLKAKNPGLGVWSHLDDMTPVIQRCCKEEKFWPAGEIEYLISQQCISPRNLQMVFEALCEKKEVGLISKALKSQPGGDVPENCLVAALQCFLGAEEKILEKALDECQPSISEDQTEDTSCPFSKAKSCFVDQILEAPFDKLYLISSLKKLPFTLVLDLLKYILHRMRTSERQAHLHKWQAHLIHAHSMQLMISKDAHELLMQFSELEELSRQFSQEIEDTIPVLKLIVSKKNLDKGNRAMGEYRIETLHL